MSAGQQALAGMGSGVVPQGLAACGQICTLPTGNTGSATITYNSDGSITKTVGGGGASATPTGPTQWASFILAGIGNGVYIRRSSLVGNAPSGPTAFTLLSSNQSFAHALNLADRDAVFDIEFSYDGVNAAVTQVGNHLQVSHI